MGFSQRLLEARQRAIPLGVVFGDGIGGGLGLLALLQFFRRERGGLVALHNEVTGAARLADEAGDQLAKVLGRVDRVGDGLNNALYRPLSRGRGILQRLLANVAPRLRGFGRDGIGTVAALCRGRRIANNRIVAEAHCFTMILPL